MKHCFISALFIILSYYTARAQQNAKKDTVYYLVDTAKIPAKDRILNIDKEANLYGYILNCKCYPPQTVPVFTYREGAAAMILSKTDLDKLNTISLTRLIDITYQFGVDHIVKNVFYFLEPAKTGYVIHEVKLVLPWKRSTTY